MTKTPVKFVPDREIIDAVRQIVRDHSGGIKMMELIPELFDRFEGVRIEPDHLENLIRDVDDLNILEYGWDMGEGVSRHKMFIYTPPAWTDQTSA